MGRLTAWIDAATSPQMVLTAGMAALALYNSAYAFRNDTVAGLDALGKRVDAIEAREALRGDADRERRGFRACLVRHIDAIEGKAPRPDCALDTPE